MSPFYKVTQFFTSTGDKIERVQEIEQELFELQAEKALLLDNYQAITKAMNCDDFACKEEVSFDPKQHITSLAELKYKERKLGKELMFLKSFKGVQNNDIRKAQTIVKSLYRQGKLNLDSYNETLKNKTNEGQTLYADIMVLDNQNRLLLTKRSQWEDDHKGAWVIPGGHVDTGEEIEHAGKRELREETGIDADRLLSNPKIIMKPSWYKGGEYKDKKAYISYFILSGVNPKDFEILLDEAETRDYKWVPKEEINNYPMIFNMADNVKKILQWDEYPQITVIRKAIKAGLIPLDKLPQIIKALHGGVAEGKSIEEIAWHHNTSIGDIEDEFSMGQKVEKEHTDDPVIAAQIARDHLWEDPHYYRKLKKIEKG